MTVRRFTAALMFPGALLAALAPAADPPADTPTEAEAHAGFLEDLAASARLAAIGYGEADAKDGRPAKQCPEDLVAAGSILVRVHKLTNGTFAELAVKPVGEDDQEVKDKADPNESLEKQAKRLFDDAKAAAAGDAKLLAAVNALIKAAEDREYGRGAIGGPKAVTRKIGAGQVHVYKIGFVPGLPASAVMRSTGQSKLAFRVENPQGRELFQLKGATAYYNWRPAAKGPFKIVVRNVGKQPTAYQLMTN
jgi:hypothetical protein